MLLKISSSTSHATVIIIVTGTVLLEICYSREGHNAAWPGTNLFVVSERPAHRIKVHPYTKTTVKVGFYEIWVNFCRNVQNHLQISQNDKSLQRKCRHLFRCKYMRKMNVMLSVLATEIDSSVVFSCLMISDFKLASN